MLDPVGIAPGGIVGYPMVITPDTVIPRMDVSTMGVVGLPPFEGALGELVGWAVGSVDGLRLLPGPPMDWTVLALGSAPQLPSVELELLVAVRPLQSFSHTCKAPVLGSMATY